MVFCQYISFEEAEFVLSASMTNIKLQLLCMQSFVMQIQSHCKSLTFPLNYIYVLHGPAFDSIQNIQDSSISIKKDMVVFFLRQWPMSDVRIE